MSLRTLCLAATAASSLLVASPAHAARISVDEDTFLDVRFLLQAWGQLTEAGAPDGESLGKDLFLRRTRIILAGQVSERVTFFFETDSPFFGRDDFKADFFVQDAFATFRLVPELNVDVGFMLVPFVHNANQSAASLIALDYRAPTFRFPAPAQRVFRDVGVQARGLLLDRVNYRVGLFRGVRGTPGEAPFEGVEGLNPGDALRVAGSLRFNFLEPENEFFYSGTYLGRRRVLSVGVAADHQADAVRDAAGELADYTGTGVDAFLDLPWAGGTQEVAAQAAVMFWRAGDGAANTGTSYYAEASYRYREVGPFVAWDRFDSDLAGGAGDNESFRFGAAWWMDGLATNLKLEVARTEVTAADGTADARWGGALQLQLLL